MISREKADHIRTLADASGHIEPQVVVDDARHVDSPLHEDFEWDVDRAASEHWLDTARGLIRFVKLEVVIERESVVAPFYVVDPERPMKSRRYLSLQQAARDEEIALLVMKDELDRIIAAIRRATAAAKVLGLADWLDKMLSDIACLKSSAEQAKEEKERERKKKSGKRPAPKGGSRRPELRA